MANQNIPEVLPNEAEANSGILAADVPLFMPLMDDHVRQRKEDGVIRPCPVQADPEKIRRYPAVSCHISLSTHDDEPARPVRKAIQDIDDVLKWHSIGGIRDFFVIVFDSRRPGLESL